MNALHYTAPAIRNRDEANRQNAHILNVLGFTQSACEKLMTLGHTVISIDLKRLKPIITIQYQSKCKKLGGSLHKRRNLGGGTESVMVSEFNHCIIQWVEPAYVQDLKRMAAAKPKNTTFNYRKQGA